MAMPAPDIDPRLQALIDQYVGQGYTLRRHTMTTATLDRHPGKFNVALAAVLGFLGGGIEFALRPTVYIDLDPDGQPRVRIG